MTKLDHDKLPRSPQKERYGEPALFSNSKIPTIPNPELLKEYGNVSSELPLHVVSAWENHHQRAFRYAVISLIIGGAVALSLVGGFIYLVEAGHGGYASALLGGGALGMVTGFRSIRL